MAFVYGPVPSRRLGRSLGIDPIPFKTCNFNCVYCQLGRTTPVAAERADFFPPEAILAEVETALAEQPTGSVDYISFVGQGEPLLCASLGTLIRGVRALTEIPVAVITNGSLISELVVREELAAADVVMPTLDAADEETFRRINRPWPTLKIERIIDGLMAFRARFSGRLWVEVMLVRGVNDTEPALERLAEALARIRPDAIHLNTPLRPPAEAWVEPPSAESLIHALSRLGEIARVVSPTEGRFELPADQPLETALEEILRRHPMRAEELADTVARAASGRTAEVLAALESNPDLERRDYRGRVFWTWTGGRRGSVRRSKRDQRLGRCGDRDRGDG